MIFLSIFLVLSEPLCVNAIFCILSCSQNEVHLEIIVFVFECYARFARKLITHSHIIMLTHWNNIINKLEINFDVLPSLLSVHLVVGHKHHICFRPFLSNYYFIITFEHVTTKEISNSLVTTIFFLLEH